MLGDAAVTLRALDAALTDEPPGARPTSGPRSPRGGRSGVPKSRRAADDRGHGVSSAAVFAALSAWCPTDAVVTVDVGNHAYSFGRYFESRGQPVLMSGYLGSIGFGYPAALGAWAAYPDRPVVAVTGDGGFGQYLAELTTAVKYAIPVKHVLIDNRALGKIAKEQLASRLPVWQTSLVNPDFAAYAELCGATGICVRHRDELDPAMEELFAAAGQPCCTSTPMPTWCDGVRLGVPHDGAGPAELGCPCALRGGRPHRPTTQRGPGGVRGSGPSLVAGDVARRALPCALARQRRKRSSRKRGWESCAACTCSKEGSAAHLGLPHPGQHRAEARTGRGRLMAELDGPTVDPSRFRGPDDEYRGTGWPGGAHGRGGRRSRGDGTHRGVPGRAGRALAQLPDRQRAVVGSGTSTGSTPLRCARCST